MAKSWRNSGFVTKFLTKFALFDEQKWHFWRQNPLEPRYSTTRSCQLQSSLVTKACIRISIYILCNAHYFITSLAYLFLQINNITNVLHIINQSISWSLQNNIWELCWLSVTKHEQQSRLRCKFDAELREVFAWWVEIVAYDWQVGLEVADDGVDVRTLVPDWVHILPRWLSTDTTRHSTTLYISHLSATVTSSPGSLQISPNSAAQFVKFRDTIILPKYVMLANSMLCALTVTNCFF